MFLAWIETDQQDAVMHEFHVIRDRLYQKMLQNL